MEELILELLIIRTIFSTIGIVGNVVLIIYILHMAQLKTYEVFLLGLASSNLGEIVVVDIYDAVILRSTYILNAWACRTLKFLNVVWESASIFFTVLISVYRYQKLRDVGTRGNLPVFMDSLRAAVGLSGGCVLLAVLIGVPVYTMNLSKHVENFTNGSSCPPDFFLCTVDDCPTLNRMYKYFFILICNLLPLAVVTGTGGFIIKFLVVRQRAVGAWHGAGPPHAAYRRPKATGFYRSTVAILVAMVVFQVDWTLYLVLHLAFDPQAFSAWSEVEFFITTSYTTISPYVYGMGNNVFSLKQFRK